MTADTTPTTTPSSGGGCCGGHSHNHDSTPQAPAEPAHGHAGGGCGGGGCGGGHATQALAAQEVTNGPTLTDAAAEKAGQLLLQEGRDDLVLRIAVAPGGCSGLRYQLVFDDQVNDDDVVSDFGGISLVVDKMSAPYLSTATIDFADTLEKSGFTIDNPAAQGSCACGDSFH